MILEALYATLSTILPAFPLIGEYDAPVPFCVYQVTPEPIKTKSGIIGYDMQVSISIIDNNIDNIETNTTAVKDAILAMSGTIDETIINTAQLTGETGAIYDKATDTYQNNLDFSLDTDNR